MIMHNHESPEKIINTFSRLSFRSQDTLSPYITHWGILSYDHAQKDRLLNLDINSALPFKRLNPTKDIGAEYMITYAVLLGDDELLDELLYLQANVKCSDGFNQGKTPLDLAFEYGRRDMIDKLIAQGARTSDKCVVRDMSALGNPIGALWVAKETLLGRQVDYAAIESELPAPEKYKLKS